MNEEDRIPEIFDIEAQVVLDNTTDLDEGLQSLERVYSSKDWKEKEKVLKSLEEYSQKLREKLPATKPNLETEEIGDVTDVNRMSLYNEETQKLLSNQPDEGENIKDWEYQILEEIEKSKDPRIVTKRDQLIEAVTDFASRETQKQVEPNLIRDLSLDFTYSLASPVAQTIGNFTSANGVANQFLRDARRAASRASSDTYGASSTKLARSFASGLGSAVGIIMGGPYYGATMIAGPAMDQYNKARNSGASKIRATSAAGIEAANQAMDYLFGRLITFGKGGKILEIGINPASQSITKVAAKAGAEGAQEVAQNRISDVATAVGGRKDIRLKNYTYEDLEEDIYAFGAGALTGTAINAYSDYASRNVPTAPPVDGQQTTVDEDLELTPQTQEEKGEEAVRELQDKFTTQPPVEGIVGEQESDVDYSDIEDPAGTVETNAGETIRINLDGTSVRTNSSGAVKQAHENITMVSEESADKLATLLEMEDPNGVPIANSTYIEEGFVVIDNPYVKEDLTLDTEPIHGGAIIEASSSGHVVQHSRISSPQGGVQNKVAISQGVSTGPGLESINLGTGGSVGAARANLKESTLADKYRNTPEISSEIKDLLGLNNEVSNLQYLPETVEAAEQAAQDLVQSYPNLTEFALALDTGQLDLRNVETVKAIGFAAMSADKSVSNLRSQGRLDEARKVNNLAAMFASSYVAGALHFSQGLSLLKGSNLTNLPSYLVAQVDNDLTTIGKVKAAEEAGVTIKDLDNADKELVALDTLQTQQEQELATIENQIAQEETAEFSPEDRETAAVISEEISNLENEIEDEVSQIDEEISLEETALLEEKNSVEKKAERQRRKDIEVVQNDLSSLTEEFNSLMEIASTVEDGGAEAVDTEIDSAIDQVLSQSKAEIDALIDKERTARAEEAAILEQQKAALEERVTKLETELEATKVAAAEKLRKLTVRKAKATPEQKAAVDEAVTKVKETVSRKKERVDAAKENVKSFDQQLAEKKARDVEVENIIKDLETGIVAERIPAANGKRKIVLKTKKGTPLNGLLRRNKGVSQSLTGIANLYGKLSSTIKQTSKTKAALGDQLGKINEQIKASKERLKKLSSASKLSAEQKKRLSDIDKRLAELNEFKTKNTKENALNRSTRRKARIEKGKSALSKLKQKPKNTSAISALEKEKQRVQRNLDKIENKKSKAKTLIQVRDEQIAKVKSKLTPQVEDKLFKLFEKLSTAEGDTYLEIRKELENIIGDLRGIPKTAPNRSQLIWMGNVLSGLGSQGINVLGNLILGGGVTPLKLALRNPKSAAIWAKNFWTNFFSKKSVLQAFDALKGNIEYTRDILDKTPAALNREVGKGFVREGARDLIKSIDEDMGTGKLYKAYAYVPAMALRALGALDAVSSMAIREASIDYELGREGFNRKQALETKSKLYKNALEQSRKEAAELKELGIDKNEAWIIRNADSILLRNLPGKDTQNRVINRVRRNILQRDVEELGFLSKASAGISNALAMGGDAISGTFGRTSLTSPNPKKGIARIAHKIFGENTPRRTGLTGENLAPVVIEALQNGGQLVINGTKINTGQMDTESLVKSLAEALATEQDIEIAPSPFGGYLKYITGMFIRTGANLMDYSMEMLPFAGTLDSIGSSKWNDSLSKSELIYGQALGLAITAALFEGGAVSDDEENSSVYVYGPMLDPQLRAYYNSKGIKPYAFRIGEQLFYYKDIPGFNLLLGGLGGINDSLIANKKFENRPLSTYNWIGSAVMGSLKTGTDMTLLRTLGVISDLVMSNKDQPKMASVADFLASPLSGWVPASGAFRDLERFMYGDSARPSEFQARLISNLPLTKFFSDTKPALNMFGEPARTSVMPFYGRVAGSSKAVFETDWLLRNGYSYSIPNAKLRPSKTDLKMLKENFKSDEPSHYEDFFDDELGYEYIARVGPQAKAIINEFAQNYPTGYSEDVQKALDKQIKAVKKQVKNQLIEEKLNSSTTSGIN